jgi:tetratricopeptide (TPR) repeat protein
MKSLFSRHKISYVAMILLIFAAAGPFTYTAMAQALLQAGSEKVDFTLKDTTGKDISLTQYSDKKAVILVFWSTWSAKSSNALKRFEEFHKKYKDKGFQVIGINADKQTITEEDVVLIKKFLQGIDVTFPVLLDSGLTVFHSYNIIALPSTIVISEGKIAYELPGLPLVGTEEMFDYLYFLAGEKIGKDVKRGYMPSYEAIANANLARTFSKKNSKTMAYAKFKEAIKKDPKYLLPYVEMAKLYASEGKNAEAEESLTNALVVEPENVVIMSELGYLYSKTGKTREAIETLKKAVAKNSYTPSHYYYAYALSKAGQTKESLASFDEAIGLNPYEPEIYLLRAESYEAAKMFQEASSDYRKSLELLLNIQ